MSPPWRALALCTDGIVKDLLCLLRVVVATGKRTRSGHGAPGSTSPPSPPSCRVPVRLLRLAEQGAGAEGACRAARRASSFAT